MLDEAEVDPRVPEPLWLELPPLASYRDHLPTLRDFDPVRHDVRIDATIRPRDTMPTLPDIDPLRHDQPS